MHLKPLNEPARSEAMRSWNVSGTLDIFATWEGVKNLHDRQRAQWQTFYNILIFCKKLKSFGKTVTKKQNHFSPSVIFLAGWNVL